MASTDIQPFATGSGANVESQAQYLIDLASGGSLVNGYQSGIAKSAQMNKVARQASFIAAGLANFCVSQGVSVPDDGNMTNLVTEITTALTVLLGTANWIAAGGTSDAITATYSPAITTLVDGQECSFRATAPNTTTAPTFSPNGLTPHTITKLGGKVLAPGDIPGSLAECKLRYDLGNTRWELLNPATLSGYAPLASPVLTGTPTAPTAAAGTASTQLATTAFVQSALGNFSAIKTTTAATLTMDSSYLGAILYASPAAAATYVTPTPVGATPGSAVSVVNAGSSAVTVTLTTPSGVFLGPMTNGYNTSSTVLQQGQSLYLVTDGTNWLIFGGSAAAFWTAAAGNSSQTPATTAFVTAQSVNAGAWANVSGSRIAGTTYTNTNSYMIFVGVSCILSVANNELIATIDGVDRFWGSEATISGNQSSVFFAVPPGKTYSVRPIGGTATVQFWSET